MYSLIRACVKTCSIYLKRFEADRSGQIAILFAFGSLAVMMAIGGAVDLSRAYAARQRLSEVAALTCQYSNRPSVVDTANSTYGGSGGMQTYLGSVNAYAVSSLSTQHWVGPMPTAPNGTYFTATAPASGPGAGATGPTNASVEMSASVPTAFMQIAHVTTIPVHAKVNCLAPVSSPQIVNPGLVLQEGFESPCASYCFTQPNGSSGVSSQPTSAFPSAPSYTGANGAQWYIVGYCLETDTVGIISPTVPQGTHSAELDCDNGSGSAGNSSISSKVYLAAGHYELRYNYRSRIDYPNYDPAYLCATTASDLAFANDTASAQGTALRTNQLEVYLDMASNSTTPLHTTIDGSQQLAGINLIDVCVYSPTWVERSVKITVTTPAYYWLSFAADGGNDSYGGQLDNIRFCPESCAGTPQDNFPATWLAANNGGTNKLLFEDSFETPVRIQDTTNPHAINTTSNLNTSYGTTLGAPPGWPSQAAAGWATAPVNQTTYVVQGAAQGQQYIELDGCATTCSNGNRLISRPFLLDPGYYAVSYQYMSMLNFANGFGTICLSAPSGNAVGPYTTFYNAPAYGSVRYSQPMLSVGNTNIIGLFMSSGQLVSTPIGGGTQGSATSYNNPDGTVTTTPTVAPDTINYYSVNAAAVNPVIDVCGYVDNWYWVPRSVSVKITKPGLYWLTFSTSGSASDGVGGGLDDVKVTALASPYTATPPSAPRVTIPVPAPQPDTVYNNSGAFNGFYIVADPFVPPAADQ